MEGEILKDLNDEYNSLAQLERQKEMDIQQAQDEKEHLSKVKEESMKI